MTINLCQCTTRRSPNMSKYKRTVRFVRYPLQIQIIPRRCNSRKNRGTLSLLLFVMRVISESEAITIDDTTHLKEKFRVDGLVYDRVGGFREEVCEEYRLRWSESET